MLNFSLAKTEGFQMFDSYHLTWLIAIIGTTMLIITAYVKAAPFYRKKVRIFISYSLLVLELVKMVVVYIEGRNLAYYLPIHLCGLAIFLIIAYTHTSNKYIGEILFSITLPGAIVALIIPGWTNEPINSFIGIHSFLYHLAIVVFPLMIVFAKEHQPNVKQLSGSVIFLALTVPAIYLFNKQYNANYMFINWPIPGTPLIALEDVLGNPGYILGLIAILLVIWLFMYTFVYLLKKIR